MDRPQRLDDHFHHLLFVGDRGQSPRDFEHDAQLLVGLQQLIAHALMFREHQAGARDRSASLWSLMMFESFLRSEAAR